MATTTCCTTRSRSHTSKVGPCTSPVMSTRSSPTKKGLNHTERHEAAPVPVQGHPCPRFHCHSRRHLCSTHAPQTRCQCQVLLKVHYQGCKPLPQPCRDPTICRGYPEPSLRPVLRLLQPRLLQQLLQHPLRPLIRHQRNDSRTYSSASSKPASTISTRVSHSTPDCI